MRLELNSLVERFGQIEENSITHCNKQSWSDLESCIESANLIILHKTVINSGQQLCIQIQ